MFSKFFKNLNGHTQKRRIAPNDYKYYRRLDNADKINLSRQRLIAIIVVASIAIALCIVLIVAFVLRQNDDHPNAEYAHSVAGVVANGFECAAIGSDILKQGGTAADAAIATLFCEGITCPQSMGLGGGFLLTIYTRHNRHVNTLIARESAPLAATENMFVGDSEGSVTGGKAIAVPGELLGYWELHQKYGKMPWAKLVQPSIELCRTGHVVSSYLYRIISSRESKLLAIPSLREIYINPATNKTWLQGERIKRLQLAKSLEIIAREGANAIYGNGSLVRPLLEDIRNFGGILTEADLQQYRVRWEEPEIAHISGDKTLYTTTLPGTGVILSFILNIIKDFLPTDNPTVTWHRVIEAFKFGYGKRTELGDYVHVPEIIPLIKNLTQLDYAKSFRMQIEDYRTYQDYAHYGANFSQPDDHGTAHISILAPNGDAVSVTSTINYIFGAMRRSQQTGIILNDEMDDFSTPGVVNAYGIPSSPANYIKPGKRPLSSMCPSIVIDADGDVQLIIGAAGGAKITTSVAYTIIRHLYFNETLHEAVDAKRIHHQLAPMKLQYERDFDEKSLREFRKIGHVLEEVAPDAGFAALTAIARENNEVVAVFDRRRIGSAVIF